MPALAPTAITAVRAAIHPLLLPPDGGAGGEAAGVVTSGGRVLTGSKGSGGIGGTAVKIVRVTTASGRGRASVGEGSWGAGEVAGRPLSSRAAVNSSAVRKRSLGLLASPAVMTVASGSGIPYASMSGIGSVATLRRTGKKESSSGASIRRVPHDQCEQRRSERVHIGRSGGGVACEYLGRRVLHRGRNRRRGGGRPLLQHGDPEIGELGLPETRR